MRCRVVKGTICAHSHRRAICIRCAFVLGGVTSIGDEAGVVAAATKRRRTRPPTAILVRSTGCRHATVGGDRITTTCADLVVATVCMGETLIVAASVAKALCETTPVAAADTVGVARAFEPSSSGGSARWSTDIARACCGRHPRDHTRFTEVGTHSPIGDIGIVCCAVVRWHVRRGIEYLRIDRAVVRRRIDSNIGDQHVDSDIGRRCIDANVGDGSVNSDIDHSSIDARHIQNICVAGISRVVAVVRVASNERESENYESVLRSHARRYARNASRANRS